MKKRKMKKPIGFIGTCKCGKILAAMDATRMDMQDVSKELGEWLCYGISITPKFKGGWNAKIESCVCDD